MLLHLSPSLTISDLQNEFNTMYPFLKIEFYSPMVVGGGKHQLMHSATLKQAGLKKTGTIQLGDATTVSDLEKNLKEKFSLRGQICRKSGNLWLETTITDNWTLKQQNEHGKELSRPAKKKTEDDEVDYE